MDLVASLPAFAIAVVLISASPGPAMALIMRRAALRGFSGAVPTVLGLEAGLYLWALFAAAGLAALVAASEVAFLALRVVGAGFLLYLFGKALRSAWRSRRVGPAKNLDERLPPESTRGWWKAFGEGAVVMLANPKAGAWFRRPTVRRRLDAVSGTVLIALGLRVAAQTR